MGERPKKVAQRPSNAICHSSLPEVKPVLTAESLEEKDCGKRLWNKVTSVDVARKLLTPVERGDDAASFSSPQLFILFLETHV